MRLQKPNNDVTAKVFVGGSRRISRLNKEIRHRLDCMVEKGLFVMLGDANGADKAVQSYFAKKNYRNVTVFCMAGLCRNNVGTWPLQEIASNRGKRDAAFFETKDRAMGAEADYGFMIWDGKSRGTLTNIKDLIGRGKPVVVYEATSKSFTTLRSVEDFRSLAQKPISTSDQPTLSAAPQSRPGTGQSLF